MLDLAGLSLFAIIVAVVSGVIGILLGVALHLVLLKQLGISTITILRLVLPVWTAILGWLLVGDRVTPMQCAFGGIILAGSFMCFRAKASINRMQKAKGAES